MQAIVEARREYMNMLEECMIPEMATTFTNMYEDTQELLRGDRGRISKFKEISGEIASWSDNVVDVHVDRIKQECPWFDKLIEATIVSLVQIMNSVKINRMTNKLSLTIPTASEFVRKCYKASIVLINKSPDFMANEDEREVILAKRISKGIDTVVRGYVPLQNIISMNISNPGDEYSFGGEESGGESEAETERDEDTKTIEEDVLMPDAADNKTYA
jgi:hypothetical protein